MYKIIGTDQKEYGPVSSDQIALWLAQGRVNAQTRAQADGGEWKTLGEFPEFAAALANRVPTSGTGVSPVRIEPAYPTPTPATTAPTSGLAIASLVLGILGFLSCGLTAIVGLILGIMAMSRVRKSNGTIGGQGLALAGTIVSAVFLIFIIPLGAALILPALAQAKHRAEAIQCMNNVRQLSISVRNYAASHENHLPPAATWCESLEGLPANFKCPADNSSVRSDYAFNAQLDGVDIKTVNGNTVLFFETEGGWDVSGGQELLLSRSRHGRTITVSFVDGHVEQVSPLQLASLRWNP